MNQYDALVARSVDSAEKWHAYLQTFPNAHPLQTWAWAEIKTRWGWTMHPTVWLLNGEPQAAAMLLRRPIPYTPFGFFYAPKGPILDYANEPLRQAIFLRLQTMARHDRAMFIKIDPDVVKATGESAEPVALGQTIIQELSERGWRYSAEQIQFRNTVVLDLSLSEDQLLGNMKPKTRYNIRLAEKKEVTVRVGSSADFDQIAEMYSTTSDRNQFAIRPTLYYLDVWHTFQRAGMLQLLIAEYEGVPLAAVVLIKFGRIALYMYGASIEHERQRMPTYLLQWEAIRWAKEQGCTLYDFWGAPDDFVENDRMWGVWRFKSGFQGTVNHHIGAWDYPAYPWLYRLYADLLPRYLAWRREKKASPEQGTENGV